MNQITLNEKFAPIWVTTALHLLSWLGIFSIMTYDFEKPLFRFILLFSIAVLYLSLWLLFSMQLVVMIDKEMIQFKPPFQSKIVKIEKATINSIQLRNVNAIAEFGGIGIRSNKGYTAYLLGGNYGIDIQHSGKKVIIGVSQYEKVKEILIENGYM